MDSKLPVGSAVEQILKNVDLASIQDERARECIRLLLNLIESLTAELRKAQAENQYLREQLQRRRGEAVKREVNRVPPQTPPHRPHGLRKESERKLRKRNHTPSAVSWTASTSIGKKCCRWTRRSFRLMLSSRAMKT